MQFDSPNALGIIVWILHFKLWGKMPVVGRLRSELWWRIQLHNLINGPTINIAQENLWDGCQAQEAPVPLEIEFNMPNLDHELLLKAWRRLDASKSCGNIIE